MFAMTGPAGAASAMATAPAAARGPDTVTAALATDRPSAAWSIRWWLIRPASAAATVSAITSTGSRSSAACAMPLTALASPGPRVTTTDPGTPVRSALVAAMIVAAVSPWASTNRSPAASAAPITSRLGPPPGTPNISRVPARTSAATIASAAAEAVLDSNEAPRLTVVILWCPSYAVNPYTHSFGHVHPYHQSHPEPRAPRG